MIKTVPAEVEVLRLRVADESVGRTMSDGVTKTVTETGVVSGAGGGVLFVSPPPPPPPAPPLSGGD